MFKKLSVSLVALGLVTQTMAAYPLTARQSFYYYAQQGNIAALQQLRAQGSSIEMSDEYGNSALCESIYRNDYSAFATLKRMGASTSHPCVRRIPPQTVQQFNQGYANWARAVNSGQMAYAGTSNAQNFGVTRTATPMAGRTAASSIVAEESGLSTATWIGIGVGAAALIGGAVAFGGGGGGGGSVSSSSSAVCSGHGSKDAEGACTCKEGWVGDNCESKDSSCTGSKTHIANCDEETECLYGNQHLYTCHACKNGWSGSTCNTPDPCTGFQETCDTTVGYSITDTCQHGNDLWYQCVCNGTEVAGTALSSGFCFTKTCENGGTPASVSTCSCLNYWSGDLCDTCPLIEGDTVDLANCKCKDGFVRSGNTCVEQTASCTTEQYWDGNNCQPCPANSASSGGQDTTCECDTGFTNLNQTNAACFVETNCNGHGIQTGDGVCSCSGGYTGDLCETAPVSAECTTSQYWDGNNCQPCPDHSSSEGGQATTCNCTGYWTGTNCTICGLTGEGITDDCTCDSDHVLYGNQCVAKPEDTNGYLFVSGEWVPDPTACPADQWGMAPACHDCPANSHSVAGTRVQTGCICEEGKSCDYVLHNDCDEGEVSVFGECYSQGECDDGYIALTQGVPELGLDPICQKYGNCSSDELNIDGACFAREDCEEGKFKFGGLCRPPEYFNMEVPNDAQCGRHGAYSSLAGKCICTEGYTGATCNIPPETNLCDNVNCGDHGVCYIPTGKCVCKDGYSGDFCTVAPTDSGSSSTLILPVITPLTVGVIPENEHAITPATGEDIVVKHAVLKTSSAHLMDGYNNGEAISANTSTVSGQNVYGYYYNDGETGREMTNDGYDSKGTITIVNTGHGNVYGMWGNGIVYMDNASDGEGGEIRITNVGNGNVYGMWATGENAFYNMCIAYAYTKGTGLISINNTGHGNVYGVHAIGGSLTGSGMNGWIDVGWAGRGMLDIYNNGNGDVYGLYGYDIRVHTVYSDDESDYLNSQGIIQITNTGSGNSYALFGDQSPIVSNETLTMSGAAIPYVNNAIYMTNTGSGTAVGMFNNKENGAIYNSGILTINNTGTGSAIGLFSAGSNGNVLNSGTITINNTENANVAIGIYSKGGNVVNTGKIIILGTNNAYGIYAAEGTTVYNTGSIQIGNYVYKGSIAFENYIYLSGSTLVNAGTVSAGSMNFDSVQGVVVAASNSKFIAEEDISGTLQVATDTVTQGFKKTYTEQDMILAGDTTGLQLKSRSALFDASLAENGRDVVMRMKSFDKVTNNASFAKFLAQNYAAGNNEAFFNTLKEIATTSALSQAFDQMMGKEMLSRFTFEDMSMMRELNFDMNNNLFNMKKDHLSMAGSVNSPMAFKGDMGSHSQYSLTSKSDGIWTVGLGVAFTDIRSEDDNDENSRSESMYQMIMPMGYKAAGIKFMTSPRLGYARGSYDRIGFDSKSYDGTIEKRIFGLMNEARYPISFGDWRFEPTAEFNMLGYEQKGREEAKEFSLVIPKQRTYSVESGVGIYAIHETGLGKDRTLKMTAGIVAYHEFADPYKMNIGMNGMDGHFTLRDERRSANRAVARAGFEYDAKAYGVSASVISYMDREVRTKANLGFKWKF